MNAPEPEHIAISKSKGIKIDWKDGHRSDYALAYLRDECPCATCTGAHGTTPAQAQVAFGFNGTAITDGGPLTRMIQDAAIGSTASVEVIRDGRRVQLKIPIGRATEQ